MTSKQIEIILTLSETLNFTKAANILYLSQPTLTYQINAIEEELRFKIFDRSQKSVAITPAGKAFIDSLRQIHSSYKRAVEQAQNYSDHYNEDIVISLPYPSAIHLLPEVMKKMKEKYPSTLITPKFGWTNRMNEFINGEVDILFDDYDTLRNLKGVKIIHLYQSRIYLVCRKDDLLAKKSVVHIDDLKDCTLMVGGGSQNALKVVQERVLNALPIPFFNADDRDTALINIAAGNGVALAPGFLNDRTNRFAWILFDCVETVNCCLAYKESDKRKSLSEFIDILLKLYKEVNLLEL